MASGWAAYPYLGMFRITHLINEISSCFQGCLSLIRIGTPAFNEKRQERYQLLTSFIYPEKKKLSIALQLFATAEVHRIPARRWCQVLNEIFISSVLFYDD